MKCANCGSEVIEAAFCGECASGLMRKCPNCGDLNPLSAWYCKYCNYSFEGAVLFPSPTAAREHAFVSEVRSLRWVVKRTPTVVWVIVAILFVWTLALGYVVYYLNQQVISLEGELSELRGIMLIFRSSMMS
jgi:hypothetical protein